METRKLGVEDKKIILELEKLCFPNDRWNQEDCNYKLSKVEENCYENPQENGFKYVLEVE